MAESDDPVIIQVSAPERPVGCWEAEPGYEPTGTVDIEIQIGSLRVDLELTPKVAR